MRILAIETSCDETAISIIEEKGNGNKTPSFAVLANFTASQASLHAKYGGVFPMMAKREHARQITSLMKVALLEAKLLKEKESKLSPEIISQLKELFSHEQGLAEEIITFFEKYQIPEIDFLAVTYGPGLEPTLWVGINFAKALSLVWNKPVMPINNMEGHIISSLISKNESGYTITDISFPALALLISGGHTELVVIKNWFEYEIIGQTRDDAVGEAFDKVARILGLPYPGGPEISKKGTLGTPGHYPLPRPMLHDKNFDFSFSGLKTAVLYLVKKLGILDDTKVKDIAREFEEAVTEVLISKTLKAREHFGAKTIVIGGGVSANTRIRETLKKEVEKLSGVTLCIPEPAFTTDNALMIAATALLRLQNKILPSPNPQTITAEGNLRL